VKSLIDHSASGLIFLAANFRAFVHSLKDAGADMSNVSISRSYAVLIGLEAYVRTRKRGKRFVQQLIHGSEKKFSVDEIAKREEEQRDKVESVATEQRFFEGVEQLEREDNADIKLLNKLHIRRRTEPCEGENKF
jgi:hypothetical protein